MRDQSILNLSEPFHNKHDLFLEPPWESRRPVSLQPLMPIDHVHALPPGTRFEYYRLDAVLGAGGFGITYRAYGAHLNKFVVIK